MGMKKTKPKKASKQVGVSFGLAEAKDLQRRAEAFHGMSVSAYIKLIVRKFIASGEKLKLLEK